MRHIKHRRISAPVHSQESLAFASLVSLLILVHLHFLEFSMTFIVNKLVLIWNTMEIHVFNIRQVTIEAKLRVWDFLYAMKTHR